MDLRKEARGKPCQVRLPGCDGGGETTVLAHRRTKGNAGIGTKPDDFVYGSWSCFHCHNAVDFRVPLEGYTRTEIVNAHCDGVSRTQMELIRSGVVKVVAG